MNEQSDPFTSPSQTQNQILELLAIIKKEVQIGEDRSQELDPHLKVKQFALLTFSPF